MVERLRRLGSLTLVIAWVALMLLLPITSFPLLSRLAGGAEVAPASILPLGWLVLFWFVPYLFKKGAIPRESIPFLFFFSIAIIASAVAFFLNIPSFKNTGILSNEIRSILTLLIGAAFYLVTASWFSKSHARLVFFLKWINISGIIVILWATIQAIYVFLFQGNFPPGFFYFQSLFSTQELFIKRISSFAFEPSWLAHQVNLFYLPFWLGATISGTSAYRFRLWKISLENILFVLGAGVVFIASRVGTLALLLVLAFVALYANILLARRLQRWSLVRFSRFLPFVKKTLHFLLPLILVVAFLGLYMLGAVGLVYLLSYTDSRLALLFQPQALIEWVKLNRNPYVLFNNLKFAERYVYWVVGWRVFNIHPFLGVGLGNVGYFFERELPSFGWFLPEVMDLYYRASALPNVKSLWMRLLAETGIVGFSSFITWFYVLFKSSWFERLSKDPVFRTVGWSGLFVLVAFIFEGFSTDTFALPYLWMSLGIVSAVGALIRNSNDET